MKLEEIKKHLLSMGTEERLSFLSSLEDNDRQAAKSSSCQQSRRAILNNKQGECPHCGNIKYVKFGSKSGSQRYKCKTCLRSFTEYTGTWMAGIHHKEKLDGYIDLMCEEKSLDKIKDELSINKKTAFDWRHKILSSISLTGQGEFRGITESDETFFLHSEKGKKVTKRKPRKRGGSSSKRGVNKEHIAVIVTQDRNKQLNLTVATNGRIKKNDIYKAIGQLITPSTILCTDSHVSYKGFAKDNKLEHHALRSDLKQRVIKGVYHIQHVNSTHNRIKKWIDHRFWGVSTKYLQQYMDWYRIKELLKNSNNFAKDFLISTTKSINAQLKYKNIESFYQNQLSTLI
jgi:transposase-like protein